MTDNFSKKLGELLSDVLETGEINSRTEEFSDGIRIESETNTQKKQPSKKQNVSYKVKLSADDLNNNFFSKRRAGQIIKEGTYRDFTKLSKNVLEAFDILGCTPDSNLSDVRAAFRKKIKKTHPDTKAARVADSTCSTASRTENLQDGLSEKIIAAYETLKDWFSPKD